MEFQKKYLVGPLGRIIEVTKGNHISEVISSPATYSLRRKDIVKLHEKLNEELGSEHVARGIILKCLLMKFWIRCYIRNSYLICETMKIRKKSWANILKLIWHIRNREPRRCIGLGLRVIVSGEMLIDEYEIVEARKYLRKLANGK